MTASFSPARLDKQQVVQGLALHRLLGQDLDIYVEAHVEAYEQAKKKWSECSMDEWKVGADGALPLYPYMDGFYI